MAFGHELVRQDDRSVVARRGSMTQLLPGRRHDGQRAAAQQVAFDGIFKTQLPADNHLMAVMPAVVLVASYHGTIYADDDVVLIDGAAVATEEQIAR